MRFSLFLLVSLIATTSVACRSTPPSTDLITVFTEPPGASFVASNGDSGTTPYILIVPRADPVTIDIEMAGYRPERILCEPKARVKRWNMLQGGWLGTMVLSSQGKRVEHEKSVTVDLEPLGAEAVPGGPE